MKIGQPSELPALVTQTKAAASQKTDADSSAAASSKTNAASGARSAGVSVTVSTAARTLEKTERGAEFNAQKVSAMRTAIQQGTFTVNPEVIADKLLDNAQDMLKGTSRQGSSA